MQKKSALLRWILGLLWIKLPVRRAKYITVVSEATKRDVLNYTRCHSDKIKVIYTNISDQFISTPKEFNNQKPTLLQIGTAPNKNLHRLIEAIQGIKCTLTIIGKLDEASQVLLKNHNISFTNYYNLSLPELINIYIQSDILTFVSTLEGFGMPIVEAQSIGRAVVTSNISSMPEVAGEGACLVDPYDINDIRKGILKVIVDKNYREDLIDKGFENVKKYQVDKIANQYYQLYKEMLHAHEIS